MHRHRGADRSQEEVCRCLYAHLTRPKHCFHRLALKKAELFQQLLCLNGEVNRPIFVDLVELTYFLWLALAKLLFVV